jgi:hypothetical protein
MFFLIWWWLTPSPRGSATGCKYLTVKMYAYIQLFSPVSTEIMDFVRHVFVVVALESETAVSVNF